MLRSLIFDSLTRIALFAVDMYGKALQALRWAVLSSREENRGKAKEDGHERRNEQRTWNSRIEFVWWISNMEKKRSICTLLLGLGEALSLVRSIDSINKWKIKNSCWVARAYTLHKSGYDESEYARDYFHRRLWGKKSENLLVMTTRQLAATMSRY